MASLVRDARAPLPLTGAGRVAHRWRRANHVCGTRARLGDVALVPFEPVAFLDPADTGESRLISRHGSLTAAEVLVPLVAVGG